MRRGPTALGLLAVCVGASAAAPPGPALLSDLTNDTLAALGPNPAGSPEEILGKVLRAATAFRFEAPGLTVVTDRRWFEVSSVDGAGAPSLELRRWPGDTALAFYDVPAETAAETLVEEIRLAGKAFAVEAWTVRDGALGDGAAARPIVWAETTRGARRLVALGVPGDAGFGAPGRADLRESILAVLRFAEVAERGGAPADRPVPPDVAAIPASADERRQSWQTLQGERFTLGLPPGLRAVRLEQGFLPPRPMPYAAAWIRGRFVDRDGAEVAVGDGVRVGYVAMIDEPDEAWRAGVGPPLGAPRAEPIDRAPLDAIVLEWTGASKAGVSHWKEAGFAGDWLVFRLQVGTRGVEIGLPVVRGWRSLALFWIPVTWRGEDLPPAPPPIDPAAGLGVQFDRIRPGERARQSLIEGTLTVGTLRLELPRGYSPVANLQASDGLPVTILDAQGELVGRIESLPAGTTLADADGWTALARPGSRKAASVHTKADGTFALAAKSGPGYLLVPQTVGKDRGDAWRRIVDSAALIRGAAR